jgi:hypothetical protein
MGVKNSGSPKIERDEKALLPTSFTRLCCERLRISKTTKIQAWQPGSAQAQFGNKAGHKKLV